MPELMVPGLIILPILLFLAGMFEGVQETLQFHYSEFAKRHPGAHPQFWNPRESWKNKYADVHTLQPAFPLSTSVLVFITDGYHLTKWLGLMCLFAALAVATDDITVLLSLGANWWLHQLVVVPVAWGIYNAGFHFTYKLYYK